jgi:hypothetical protein
VDDAGGVRRVSPRCSRAHSSDVGEVFSSAHESRWRKSGTWASQQPTEQNAKSVALRLHVETLHAKYGARNAIERLQLLQRFQVVGSSVGMPPSLRESDPMR